MISLSNNQFPIFIPHNFFSFLSLLLSLSLFNSTPLSVSFPPSLSLSLFHISLCLYLPFSPPLSLLLSFSLWGFPSLSLAQIADELASARRERAVLVGRHAAAKEECVVLREKVSIVIIFIHQELNFEFIHLFLSFCVNSQFK